MQILCVDVGTGTQDILLFDSERELENCVQLIAPSPTQIVAAKIRRASAAGWKVLLVGRTMGGGPCAWAAEEHLRHGGAVFATPDAARTFDDELEKVERMGVRVVSDDEARGLRDVERIRMDDFDLSAITASFASFEVDLDLAAIAIAVFDHGNAPPGVSDRVFRFEYLAETVARNDLAAFAYRREDLPARLTRMRAAADAAPPEIPTLVMDTGPAAVLGALEDPVARRAEEVLVANLGNFHTLAFHLASGRILGLFEHHTGELTRPELERYLRQLAAGTISNEEVFNDMGHGALVVERQDGRPRVGTTRVGAARVGAAREPPASLADMPLLAVTGPRRSLLEGSDLQPYLAVPHGDMMLAGCFGLLRAVEKRMPELAEAMGERLAGRM